VTVQPRRAALTGAPAPIGVRHRTAGYSASVERQPAKDEERPMSDDRAPAERDDDLRHGPAAERGSGDVPNPETGVGLGATEDASTFEPEEDPGEEEG
jgi:hypothetical protein